jgi:hypothetical protein
VVDIAGPSPGSSAITATSLLPLESVLELLQKESVLFDLGLKFTELLQVQALKLSGGKVLVPRCRWDNTWRCGVAFPRAKRGTVAYPFVLVAGSHHPEPDVETLASGIISVFIVGVRITEAVVARGQEAAHCFRVAKLEKVCFASSSSEESAWV